MSDEIRTRSETGGEKGVKAERHDLVPREGIDAIARVYGFGAQKYEDHNWRRGYEWSKSYAALERHVKAFWSGETYDPESGLPHLAHAGFHILALLTWLEQDGEFSKYDDRWSSVLHREQLQLSVEQIQANLSRSQLLIGRTISVADEVPDPVEGESYYLIDEAGDRWIWDRKAFHVDKSWHILGRRGYVSHDGFEEGIDYIQATWGIRA